MDDWDARREALVFKEGARVTVNGVIDDDFFETTTIEAGAVYVELLPDLFAGRELAADVVVTLDDATS